MKKLLIVLILVVSMFLLVGCSSEFSPIQEPGKDETITAYISIGDGTVLTVEVKRVSRISNGCITIEGYDGVVYSTDEKNLVLMRKSK